MAEKRYNLNEKSRQTLLETTKRSRAMHKSMRPVPTRRVPRGSAGDDPAQTQVAILFKDVEAAAFAVNVSGDAADFTATVTPSALVEECVMPLAMEDKDVEDRSPTDPLIQTQDDDDNAIVYDAVNGCWLTDIKAGDGADNGDGTFNEPPVLVEGFVRDYQEGDTAKKYFFLTDVINPAVIYEATLNAAMTSGDATAEVTPTADIWGKRPSGTRTVYNDLGWDADSGATAIVLRGYANDVFLNVECPA